MFEIGEGVPEPGEVIVEASDFNFGSSEMEISRDEPEVVAAGWNHGVGEGPASEESAVHAMVVDGFVAECTGRVGLGVEVHEENSFAEFGQSGGQVHGGGGFSDSTFLIGHCDHFHFGSYCKAEVWFEKCRFPNAAPFGGKRFKNWDVGCASAVTGLEWSV